jgi:LmbE family N-acetylglucosaminyl deacetylase
MLTSVLPANAYVDEDHALTRQCKYESTNRPSDGINELWDTNSSSRFVVKRGGTLKISWRKNTPAKSLYLEWYALPQAFTMTQYREDGSEIITTPGETYELNQLYPIAEEARSISLSSAFSMDLCTAVIYGPNVLPKDYHAWQPTPEKLDYLVVATHPDDDVIFMGAIVPIYGVERGLQGTIAYTCTSNIRYRCNEALNGAWAMGLRNHPIFAGFPDILPSKQSQWEFQFKVKALTQYYVRLFRQYRPEVVITHDTAGEYGHWQHINVSKAVCEAVSLAADASYDPESAGQYGIFQVKKLYLHLYPENRLKLDVWSHLESFQGKNVIEIAREAFRYHISQQKASHYHDDNKGVYSLSDYGLYYSNVGPDSDHDDMFEHIDSSSLSGEP